MSTVLGRIPGELNRVLGQQYHVVVGNPPGAMASLLL